MGPVCFHHYAGGWFLISTFLWSLSQKKHLKKPTVASSKRRSEPTMTEVNEYSVRDNVMSGGDEGASSPCRFFHVLSMGQNLKHPWHLHVRIVLWMAHVLDKCFQWDRQCNQTLLHNYVYSTSANMKWTLRISNCLCNLWPCFVTSTARTEYLSLGPCPPHLWLLGQERGMVIDPSIS